MAAGKLASISLDCEEPAVLAEFWAALVGGEVAFRSEEFCAVRIDNRWLATVKIENYSAPTRPNPQIPKQMHFDLAVSDLDAAESEALQLGARKLEHQAAPDRWRVMADPAGHPFCFSIQNPD
jgi:hypothetical protein